MERRGVGKRLTDGQRVEIIKLFESGAAVTEADVARRYGVSRSAIWRLRRASSQIMERYQDGDIESRDELRRGSLNSASRQLMKNAAAVAPHTSHSLAATASAHASLSADAGGASAASIVMDVEALTDMASGATTPSLLAATIGTMNGTSASDSLTDADAALNGLSQPASSATVAAPSPHQQPLRSVVEPPAALPLVYLSAKAISSVQAPGVVNWERVNGADDARHFHIVHDGVAVALDGVYQINVDLAHSQPRQVVKCVFKLWNGKRVLAQCNCPLRTTNEVALSLVEVRARLPANAQVRVEFLAAGYAFHESRFVIRRLPQ